MRSCAAGCSRAPMMRRDGGLEQRLDEEGRLAAARHAGDAGEDAERDLGGDVLQVVAARADDLDALALLRLAALGRHRDLAVRRTDTCR